MVINGDFSDCYTLSPFSKDPLRGGSFAEEAAQARTWLEMLRKIVPNAKIMYLAGNHEHRLHKYLLSEAPELRGVRGLSLPEQYNLEELEIEWVAPESDRFVDNFIPLGRLLVGHFNRASKHAGYTVKNLIDDYGVSLIQGHTHSFGSHNRNLAHGEVMGWESGCLCNLEPFYCRQKNWRHAFCVVHHHTMSDYFCVEPIGYVKHKFFYGGKLWEAGGNDHDQCN